ncbi:MAG: hypothetical protein NTZ32_11440 [Planctomycetales bacterium]|nr:hypothetical protein [Planctomycetales bacterium]
MKRISNKLILVALVALASFNVSGQAPDQPRKSVLSVLKEGQAVTLKDNSGRFEIGTFDGGPIMLGHKVVEVGTDYLTIEDIAGVIQTRIPIWSIKSIVKLTVPRK